MNVLGAVVGDIIGSTHEFGRGRIKRKDFDLFPKGSTFTDDSVLTIALADSILTGVSYTENMRKFFRLYPDGEYGTRFREWAMDKNAGPYNSFGNGSAMRISPVAYAYGDIDTVLQKAEEFTIPTHGHLEGIKGAQATAAAIFFAKNGHSKHEIKFDIESMFGYDLSKHVDDIRPNYKFDETCQETVPQAIISFLDSTDFEDAIRNAVSLGGDADTLACITGSIAQAFYKGVPEEIAIEIFPIIDNRMTIIMREFMDKYEVI
jgi:ADP-ribosylglycohydrolase